MFSKWLPKWWMQWHDVFGNTFYEIYAPQNIDIIVKIETLRLLVSEIGLFLEMSAILLKWPPKWRIQWHDVFGNTLSDIYAPENLYIESTMMALRLLVSEIWWHSGHFFKWPPKPPRGKSWLGTIAKFTWFGMVYICAKFHAFTTKCTIHSMLVT